MLGCEGLSEITMMVSITKINIDIKYSVFKYYIPGGRLSWMLFCVQRPTGKIFLEFELHHMAGRLLSLHVIMLSISTWKKNLLGILVTIAAQMEEGSLGFTASSFKLFVNPLLTKSYSYKSIWINTSVLGIYLLLNIQNSSYIDNAIS